ncbi:hypothetical protein SAMN05421736_104101 [Evansella caseinilytica]|uniref:YdbS-like PH domain-containing protein n=1 Tax=Evansella caseinilytica TaxID=1503961 RepID=A0A1H3NJS0_9BACI|nr:PH domain-containing protein [Evansella caseinilytica]SDY89068.1 hypothetical protein SAMN05421736_104101 [Evansella caseinilytica]
MRATPDQRLTKKALKVWRITASLEMILYLLLAVGYGLASRYFNFSSWVLLPIIIFIITLGYVKIAVIPELQWKRWRYKIYENEVELLYGVFVVRRVIIPMIRVQHVDTKQGPILRRYRLAAVTISTAATVHEIPGLEEKTADELRDYIAGLAREADPDD